MPQKLSFAYIKISHRHLTLCTCSSFDIAQVIKEVPCPMFTTFNVATIGVAILMFDDTLSNSHDNVCVDDSSSFSQIRDVHLTLFIQFLP